MRLKKCPMCKIMVPGKIRTCPVCGSEYTKFQYFKMNILSKCILVLLALLVVYNMVVVIVFNRTIKGYVDNPPKDISQVERLKKGYEGLNFIQKYFVQYSDIEIVERDFIDEDEILNVENQTCEVRFYDGNRIGVYTGEFYDEQPEGDGMFSYYLDDGTLCVYEGEFENGEITGSGIMTFADGTKYVGAFEDGVLSGNASVYNPSGYIIKKGEFVLGKLNGIATIYDDYGVEIYSGRFNSEIPTKAEYVASCISATFAQLEADTDNYVNKNLKISGVITEIAIQDDMTVLYVMNIAGNKYKNICFNYIGDKGVNIRQGDYMTFYGYCEGYRQFVGGAGETQGGMFVKTYHVE